jgi:hypothetical protein
MERLLVSQTDGHRFRLLCFAVFRSLAHRASAANFAIFFRSAADSFLMRAFPAFRAMSAILFFVRVRARARPPSLPNAAAAACCGVTSLDLGFDSI